MRILLISRSPPYPLYLGDRLIVHHLARELELRGHELDLIAYASRPDDAAEQGQYDAGFRSVTLIPEPRRSLRSVLGRAALPSARWPRSAGASWSAAMWSAIRDHLARRHYDAIHLFGGIHVYEFHHALGGQPVLITPYESFSLYLRRAIAAGGGTAAIMARLQRVLARRFESFMFAPYARTVVVSEADRDELLALNPALPIEVIPNGVDTNHFRPRPLRRVPALLFVGNYEYAPNVDAALRLARELFPAVRQQVPAARLWLVGHAPPAEVRALAGEQVRVTGHVPDVRPYLARAGVFVSPLRLGAGIKNKVLEAMAMGCPVAATPLSLDGIAAEAGRHVLAAEGPDLVDAVTRVLTDADLPARLGAAGRQLIESHYSWASVAARYEALYREIARTGD